MHNGVFVVKWGEGQPQGRQGRLLKQLSPRLLVHVLQPSEIALAESEHIHKVHQQHHCQLRAVLDGLRQALLLQPGKERADGGVVFERLRMVERETCSLTPHRKEVCG